MRRLRRVKNRWPGGLPLPALLLALWACEEPPVATNSVVLSDGAYVRIANRQDDTSLVALNASDFSLEIWAAGSVLPAGVQANPTMFMISNDLGDNEIGVFRTANDSASIIVWVGNSYVGSWSIAGCNWNDPDVFTQVVVTYDGSRARVYGNGEFLGSRASSQDLNIGASDALIGAHWDTPNEEASLDNFWYGAIDEVRLWTKVLPSDEIEFHFENPGKLTRTYSAGGLEPLLGLWRFNEPGVDGDEEPDGSGKGNAGILRAGNGRLTFDDGGA